MCVIWGIPYLMIRVAVRELAPVTLVFLRTGLAALLLVPLTAPPLGVVAASLALSAVVYAPLAAFRWPGRMPSAHVVESVVGLAVVCSAAAFLIFFALIAEVGPVRATVITYVNPAVAAVVGVLLLSERVTAGMLIGFALVLAGSVLATGRSPEAVPEP